MPTGDLQVTDGTSYRKDTDRRVVEWLETSRERKQRIRVFCGKDGEAWNEEHDIIGHVSRSMGPAKVPILMHNARSLGGPRMLDDRIYRIDTKYSRGKICTVYLDRSVREHRFTSTAAGNVYDETADRLYARCKDGDAGKRLAAFMNGERWSR